MHGKLLCSQFASTFLFLNRFSIAAVFTGESHSQKVGTRVRRGATLAGISLPAFCSLLTQSEIRLAPAGDGHGLGLILCALMPNGKCVAAVGNVFDLVIARVVSFGKVWSWADDDISRHFRVYVAKQRDYARFIEGKGPLLTLRPRPQIVSRFLVGTNRGPENVMLHAVAIQKLNRCALLYGHDVRCEHQAFLIHHGMLFGSGERFSGDGIDIDHRVTLHSRNLALDVASPGHSAYTGHHND